MMKRLFSLALVLALACSLAIPTAAAEQAGDRLAAVTAQVKETLGLDTEAYTEFYGELSDNPLMPCWFLNWYGDGISLSVSVSEEGKILEYYASSDVPSSSGSLFAPAFPAVSREQARQTAGVFLDKVLAGGESVLFNEDSGPINLGSTRYRFSGEILVNGLSAGLDFSISVGCEENTVRSFYRSDLAGQVIGGIPSPAAAVSAGQAAAALRDTLAMRLEYVLPGDGSTHAVLRYLPEGGDEYYVDAATGELVNLSELYRKAAEGGFGDMGSASGGTSADSVAAESENGLSRVEQEGIAKLEGVLDREELDGKVRALTALGLDSYTLSTVDYMVGREAGEDGVTPVTAVLRYGKQVGDAAWRRTATVDARTGELTSLYSSGRLNEESGRAVDFAAAQEAAEDFLASFAPAQFGKTALYNSRDAGENDYSVSHSFTFTQQENGCFYAGNAFYVGVDSTDGSISSYEKHFDDSVTFDSPEGVITYDQAIDAWLATYDTALQYVLAPAAIDFSQPEYEPLAGMGFSYLYKLVLAYQLERSDYLLGIDAKTGLPVEPEWTQEDGSMTYGDLAGHWAKDKIETLAQYRVGYAGGSFQPGKELTQLDLVALLMSAEGYLYQPGEEDSLDWLYERAYSMGLLKREERDEDALLTRAQTVKLILNAAGYGSVADLKGIFRTGFADDGDIPAEYYGYAALAQGLGVVTGAPGSRFLPNAGATRAEAAVMLYNLMDR